MWRLAAVISATRENGSEDGCDLRMGRRALAVATKAIRDRDSAMVRMRVSRRLRRAGEEGSERKECVGESKVDLKLVMVRCANGESGTIDVILCWMGLDGALTMER